MRARHFRNVIRGYSRNFKNLGATIAILPALDEPGEHVARDENGVLTATREKRWRELGRIAVKIQDLLNIIERPYVWFSVIFSMNPEYENVSAGSSA